MPEPWSPAIASTWPGSVSNSLDDARTRSSPAALTPEKSGASSSAIPATSVFYHTIETWARAAGKPGWPRG